MQLNEHQRAEVLARAEALKQLGTAAATPAPAYVEPAPRPDPLEDLACAPLRSLRARIITAMAAGTHVRALSVWADALELECSRFAALREAEAAVIGRAQQAKQRAETRLLPVVFGDVSDVLIISLTEAAQPTTIIVDGLVVQLPTVGWLPASMVDDGSFLVALEERRARTARDPYCVTARSRRVAEVLSGADRWDFEALLGAWDPSGVVRVESDPVTDLVRALGDVRHIAQLADGSAAHRNLLLGQIDELRRSGRNSMSIESAIAYWAQVGDPQAPTEGGAP
jgi:hypothetical protein